MEENLKDWPGKSFGEFLGKLPPFKGMHERRMKESGHEMAEQRKLADKLRGEHWEATKIRPDRRTDREVWEEAKQDRREQRRAY